MAATPNYSLPYPEILDTADVPRDIQALASALDALLDSGNVTTDGTLAAENLQATFLTILSTITATGTVTCADPIADQHAVTRKYWTDRTRYGPVASRPSAGSVPEGTVYFGY